MRVSFIVFLISGVLTAVHCATLDAEGTEDSPFPEDHEESEDAEDAEEADESDGEEGEDAIGEDGNPLQHYEDKGEGDKLTVSQMRELHGKFDHNGDGKVHIDEVMKFAEHTRKAVAKKEIAGVFDEIESTKDGHLSLEEHMAETEEFHEGDEANKDVQRAHEKAKFKAADTNKDDKLDVDELVHLMHPETHPEVMELHLEEEMRKKDTDKDGKLSKKEWEADPSMGDHQDPDTHDASSDFPKLDSNGDGFINIDELRHWESGRYHTEDAMGKLFGLADKDGDSHMTADEFAGVVDHLDGHDAHPHLLDWVNHDDL